MRAYTVTMQSPMIVFDHIKKITFAVPTGPNADRRLDELLASQRKQLATSGRPAS
jgi:hypothetical protein